MNAKIFLSEITGGTAVVTSKSYAHRAAMLAAVSRGNIILDDVNFCADITATVRCLEALGFEIEKKGGSLVFSGGCKNAQFPALLDCGESGSTLRFMLPFAAALGLDAELTGAERLFKRPLADLTDALSSHGVRVKSNPLSIGGRLTGGEFEIAASVSSQYISGLLMALPLTGVKSIIKLRGGLVSKGYVGMTLELMRLFGAEVRENSGGYTVYPKPYTIPSARLKMEGDWSNGAFLLAAGALTGKVTVDNLNLNSSQGDKRIYNILEAMGCRISNEKGITAEKSALKAVNVDITDIPDLAPVLSVLMSYAQGISVMTGVERLRDKESDRLNAIIEMLGKLGGSAEYSEGALYVKGGRLKGGTVPSYNDHRMVMAAAVAAVAADGETVIQDCGAVGKSYGEFFETVKKLGGRICLTD